MAKEQGEAIYRLKTSINTPLNGGSSIIVDKEDIETVLNILKENSAELAEKSAEIEKKDKQIDLMANYIVDLIKYNNPEEKREVEEIKQYFERKAEK